MTATISPGVAQALPSDFTCADRLILKHKTALISLRLKAFTQATKPVLLKLGSLA